MDLIHDMWTENCLAILPPPPPLAVLLLGAKQYTVRQTKVPREK